MKYLTDFLKTWAPENPRKYGGFVEAVRGLLINSKVQFRRDQVEGNFTDGTGDAYLETCLKSLGEGGPGYLKYTVEEVNHLKFFILGASVGDVSLETITAWVNNLLGFDLSYGDVEELEAIGRLEIK